MIGANNENDPIKEAIIKTVAFFDLFDYPLTLFEVRRYLYLPQVDYELAGSLIAKKVMSIESFLEELSGENIIGEKNGFYFFKGREGIVAERQKRYNRSGRKIGAAKKIIRLFSALPWIKMIALGNVMGTRNFRKESDIDFFIVTAKNRIWITRLFSAGLAAMLGLRPREGQTEDKICLSFFIAEDRLELGALAGLKELLSGTGRAESDPEDIYFTYWLAGLIPLYDRGDIFKKLHTANRWLEKRLPNFEAVLPSELIRTERSLMAALASQLIGVAAGWLEPLARKIQRDIFPPAIKEKLNQGTDVVADNGIIKLHVNDRRRIYGLKWERRIRQVLSGMEK
jgi:hypothetical protein